MSNLCRTDYLFDYNEDDHGSTLEVGIRTASVLGNSCIDQLLVITQMYQNNTDETKSFELHLCENDLEFIIKTWQNIQKTLKSVE